MIRECTEEDRKLLGEYLQDEAYGRAIQELIDKYGFDNKFQSVYLDEEEIDEDQAEKGEERGCNGVYLCFYKNLLLYSKENQVDIDFLEQIISMMAPEMVTGRKDNVNIVSWLLTDYRMDTLERMPDLCDEEGNPLQHEVHALEPAGEWAVLLKDN